MSNDEIADLIKLYADLYELHGGNPFKIKSFSAAAFKIDKLPVPLSGKSMEELEQVDGVGKSLAAKIHEINTTGSFEELNKLLQATPEGVLEMMKIKGIGPKKIAHIWKEIGIESIGELLYACRENRLAQAKGFGLKTQQNIIKQIEFMFVSANKFHYAKLEAPALQLIKDIRKQFPSPLLSTISFCGKLRRKCEVLEVIELIVSTADRDAFTAAFTEAHLLKDTIVHGDTITGKTADSVPVSIVVSEEREYARNLVLRTGSEAHIQQLGGNIPALDTEKDIYQELHMPFIEPELREGLWEVERAKSNSLPQLIELSDLKGILHNHSTYSDGLNTLEEMAVYCKELGYQYLGMCDHSKSAFYANGLKEDRILLQHEEINRLNERLAPFRIFKGIESDILNDGSLDYPDEVLQSFDFIVASVHSNLKMTEEKAMARLLKAIENPHTTILGHPTGRLLLMREGYPVDHRKMIDACAANGVVIEINAHPYRLDLDWRWIDYALGKGVKLSINPDAHEREGYHDMYFGICVARKGGLTREMCLNAMSLEDISSYFKSRK
jgi:DNA polymerase (family 10)